MEIPLRVLIIEDSEDDALLVFHQLERAGYKLTYERVETRDAMREALERQAWDIIISDYKMPRFSGLAALKLFKEKGLDIPFIIVSGTIGEEIAAEAMVSGAHDYVMKNNLPRLIPAIQRELREAESRRERKRAEEALLSSEQKYRTLLENASDAIMIADSDGNFLEINKKAEELLGYTREEVLGLRVSQVHPKEELERVLHAFGEIVEGKIDSLADTKVLRKDGKTVPVDITGTVIEYEGRRVVQGIVRDITERKRAEEALRASEKQYRILFEEMDEGFCVVEMLYGPDGKPVDYRFVEINQAFEKHTGLQQALGKTIRQMVPDHDAHWFKIYGKVARTGESIRFENPAVAMQRYYDVYAFRIGGEDSQRVGVLFNDITQRKRSEEALKLSEAQYRSIFENVVEGIFQTTPEGRFLVVNPSLARIYGYDSPEEMIDTVTDIGRQIYVNPDERDEFLRIIQEKGIVTGLELQLRRKDGSTFWGSINASSVYDKDGKFLYYEGTTEDITERKMVQDALRRKVDELERFSSLTVGRELRIIELKKEINSLLKKAGQPEKHRIAE